MRWPTRTDLPFSIRQTTPSRTSAHWRLGTPAGSQVFRSSRRSSVARDLSIDACTVYIRLVNAIAAPATTYRPLSSRDLGLPEWQFPEALHYFRANTAVPCLV